MLNRMFNKLKSEEKSHNYVIEFSKIEDGVSATSSRNCLVDDSKVLEHKATFFNWTKFEQLKVAYHDFKEQHAWFRYLPIFIIVVTVVKISVFLGYHGTEESAPQKSIWENCPGCFIYRNGSSQPGPLLFVGRLRHEAWRFISYIFLHHGLFHMLQNCFVQILVGVPLELFHGSWRIACVYVIAVIAASLFYCFIDENYQMVGASAGVFALVFTYLSHVAVNFRDLLFRWYLAPITLFCVFICIVFVYDLINSNYFNTPDEVAHFAHIIGAITGSIYGFLFPMNHPQ